MGLLWYSRKKFKDFILEVDYKCSDPETNSGIFLESRMCQRAMIISIIHLRFRSMMPARESTRPVLSMMPRLLQLRLLNRLATGTT